MRAIMPISIYSETAVRAFVTAFVHVLTPNSSRTRCAMSSSVTALANSITASMGPYDVPSSGLGALIFLPHSGHAAASITAVNGIIVLVKVADQRRPVASNVAARARDGLEHGKLGLVVMRDPRMPRRGPDPGRLFLPAVSVAAAAIPALAAIAPIIPRVDLFPGISGYLFTAALRNFLRAAL